MRAVDRHKDQTYYLSGVPEAALAKAIFPLGELTKPEVRELASKYGLPTASREESMGICFVGEKRRFSDFLGQCLSMHCIISVIEGFSGEYILPKPGPIVESTTNRRIGTHQGLWTYTIGENARIAGMRERMFVSRSDLASNTLHVVPGT